MSTETKYQVMGELLGIMPSAIEKADEQASRIISIVKGKCSCSIPCGEETLNKLDKLFPSEPEEDFTASVKVQPPHPEFRPKHTTTPTPESLALTDKIVSLKGKGLHWHQIAAKVGLSKEATRKRYRSWEEKHPKEFYVTPKDEPENAIEPYEPGAEDAAAEATLAEEVLKSANQNERGPSKDEQIDQLIRSYANEAFDIEILQAVRRQFPGCSLTVADIRARRRS